MRKNLFVRAILSSAVLVMASVAMADETPLLHATLDGSLQAQTRSGPCTPQVEGQPAFVDGIQGKAVVVGGKDRVLFPAKDIFNPQAGTCMLWVAPQDWTATTEHFQFMAGFTNEANASSLYFYKFYSNNDMGLMFMNKDGQRYLPHAIASWQKGQWHHLAATWDKQGTNFYIDGERVGQDKAIELPADGWQSLILGISFPGWGMLGTEKTALNDLFVFDHPLTPEQVKQAYSQAVAASPLLQKQGAAH